MHERGLENCFLFIQHELKMLNSHTIRVFNKQLSTNNCGVLSRHFEQLLSKSIIVDNVLSYFLLISGLVRQKKSSVDILLKPASWFSSCQKRYIIEFMQIQNCLHSTIFFCSVLELVVVFLPNYLPVILTEESYLLHILYKVYNRTTFRLSIYFHK